MDKKAKEWLKNVAVRTVKTMAETALGVIGSNAVGVTDVDWLGVLSAAMLAGVVTVLFNIKGISDDLK